MRRLLPGLGLLLTMLLLAPPALGDAADVSAAQRRANEAVAALADAQSELAIIEAELAELRTQSAAAEAHRATLATTMRDVAVRRYVNVDHGDEALTYLDGDLDINAQARAAALARFVNQGAADVQEEWRAVSEDLAATGAAMAEKEAAQEAAIAGLAERERELRADFERLAEEERQRVAEQRRREAEEARRRAEAAERAAQSDRAARAQRAAEAQRAAQSQRSAQNPRAASAPVPTVAVPDNDSNDSNGGQGEANGETAGAGGGGWVCPVGGAHAFSNDWGQPRSGGRRHQGNDMVAARGTPIVAPVGGTVTHRSVSLGGLSFFLQGDDGTEYFGTHMDSYGEGGRVSAGTVIGYVGNTGNASGGVTHLHFEIHPGGGGAVNPYPTLRANC